MVVVLKNKGRDDKSVEMRSWARLRYQVILVAVVDETATVFTRGWSILFGRAVNQVNTNVHV